MQRIKFIDFFNPFPVSDQLSANVETVPATVVYFVYNRTWWNIQNGSDVVDFGAPPTPKEVVTDLPVRHVGYVGRTGDYNVVFTAASVDGDDVAYFDDVSMTSSTSDYVYDTTRAMSCCRRRRRQALIDDITRQMALIYAVRPEVTIMPLPTEVIAHEWTTTPSGGGRFMWRRGVNWEDAAERLQRPDPAEDVFIVGDAYASGRTQLWAEGALESVERLLGKHLTSPDLVSA